VAISDQMDASEDGCVNPQVAAGRPTIGDLIEARLSRRGLLAAGGSAVLAAGGPALAAAPASAKPVPTPASFAEIERGMDDTHHVPAGHVADLVLRWGDPIFADAPAFDPARQTAAAQERQFGYNNDFIGLVPLPEANGRARALLCVNHEYTSTRLMLPGLGADFQLSAEQCAVERAAHGGSIVEIAADADGRWRPVVPSRFNRRITADTPMLLTGPAAGHPRMRTSADPGGKRVLGTLNNCAGGITPWGTYLMAEENINLYFMGELPGGHPEAANHKRMGVPASRYQWGRHEARFDLAREPNEPNRFGWVVEVDPTDPTATPMKRTALGRFKHEGAETVVAPDGRVVLYMGDDQRFDYVYKFVTKGRFNPRNRRANARLLDEGTLYVARFDAEGGVAWLPLVHGFGPLTAANGFGSQAEVLIETRRAADLLGATPMDRPEDVEPDAGRGRVFVMLTNNSQRKPEQVDAANPRAKNSFGHIIEIVEPEGDFAATASKWSMLVRCGDPSKPGVEASFHPATSSEGWFGSPDNAAIDPSGRLWVATDGNDDTGASDGVWAVVADGAERGLSRHFFRAPVGAEVCGPRFDAAGGALFVAVQHPGDSDVATFEDPATRWPDFADGMPPRPSVLAIRREGGGPIGG